MWLKANPWRRFVEAGRELRRILFGCSNEPEIDAVNLQAHHQARLENVRNGATKKPVRRRAFSTPPIAVYNRFLDRFLLRFKDSLPITNTAG
jgi:hypothetical protein